jgi:hypothetical protein
MRATAANMSGNGIGCEEEGWWTMLRRYVVALSALMLLALLPLSASAAAGSTQTLSATVDIASITGTCPTANATGGDNNSAQAAGALTDVGTFKFFLDTSGPFPNQVSGVFGFQGAHSWATLEYTGTVRCLSSQSFQVSGAVWSGFEFDEATGKGYSLNGSGRGNTITLTLGPGGLNIVFTGTAKLSSASPTL